MKRRTALLCTIAIATTVAMPAVVRSQQPQQQQQQQPAAPAATALREALAAALEAMEAKDYATAERQFARVTELEPRVTQAWLGLAESRLRLDRAADALAAAKRAQSLAPEEAGPVFMVARCQAELGAIPEALAASERARELDPESLDATLLSALLLRRLNREQEGAKLLEAAWAKGSRDLRLAEQLAFSRFDRGDTAGAAAAAEAGLKVDPKRANLKVVLGFALAKDPARRADAIRALEEAIAAGVAEPGQVQLVLGGLLLDEGKAAEALPHLEDAARALPEVAGAHYKLAQARRAAGDEPGAEQALARFSELEARSHSSERGDKELGIALNDAQVLANENKLTEAIERLDALIAEHPDDARVLALRAKVLYSMGRRREAEISIDAAAARMPERAEYQYLSGLFHMYAGRPAQAQAALERALAIDGQLATAHALLAGALVKQGKAAESLTHFEKAIELGADSPEVRLGYAEALKTLDRGKEAEVQMEGYRRLAPRQ